MIAILLFCNLVFLNLALADRGGVSGGGGEDGLRPELIDLNGDRSKLFLKCPGEQIPLECSECKSAITKEGNVIQSKLDTICEMNFKNQ
jgi:hypothetical protein